MLHRPTYTDAFYNIVYDHHRLNGGQWKVAHDVGTGPGIVAEELSRHFGHVLASDASAHYSSFAQQRLSSLNAEKFQTKQVPAERINEWPASSKDVDLITIAEAIHWTPPAAALTSASQALRPRGTLAIWVYGAPIFGEDVGDAEAQEKCQALLQEIIERSYDRMRPFASGPFPRAANMLHSYLDNIAFPNEDWQSLKRVKWNCDRPLEILDSAQLDFEVTYETAVTTDEEIEEITDRKLWAVNADVGWLRGYVEHIGPRKEKDLARLNKINALYAELEVAMGGKGKKCQLGWPVVLLLATKA